MRIVENSFYEHERYGTVKVVDVTNGVVSMQQRNETVMTTAGNIPGGKQQAAAGFQDEAEPADIEINAQPAMFQAIGNDE